jgi:hypothetical protein
MCCPLVFDSSLTQIPTLVGSDFGVLGKLLSQKPKWCDCDMVEADSHLKQLPTSIWHIFKVFEHIDMMSIGIQRLGHLWSRNDVIMSCLRLTAISNCFPHYPHETLQSVWVHWYAWFCCCCHHAGVFAVNLQVSSLLLSWHRALAPSPFSSGWCCRPSCQWAWPLNRREGPPLLHTHRQVASASALVPMQLASQWKRRTSVWRHINNP